MGHHLVWQSMDIYGPLPSNHHLPIFHCQDHVVTHHLPCSLAALANALAEVRGSLGALMMWCWWDGAHQTALQGTRKPPQHGSPKKIWTQHGGFHSHGGSPSHHPFEIGIFPNKNYPAIYWSTPIFLWKIPKKKQDETIMEAPSWWHLNIWWWFLPSIQMMTKPEQSFYHVEKNRVRIFSPRNHGETDVFRRGNTIELNGGELFTWDAETWSFYGNMVRIWKATEYGMKMVDSIICFAMESQNFDNRYESNYVSNL